MGVDERREALLDCGRKLFTTVPYDELSMAMIAKEAGISKALLYHYFPSKQVFFMATIQEAAERLAERVRPDADDPLRAQLDSALGEWLAWIDDNRDSYGKLLQSANSVAEVRGLVDEVRSATVELILERLLAGDSPDPEVRAAVCGWLWFMDGVCLNWVRDGDLDLEQVHSLLAGTLPGALAAAGHPQLSDRLN